jgi:hypothetical protein
MTTATIERLARAVESARDNLAIAISELEAAELQLQEENGEVVEPKQDFNDWLRVALVQAKQDQDSGVIWDRR